MPLRPCFIPAVLVASLFLTGCGGFGVRGSGGSGAVVSDAQSTRLDLTLPTRAAVVQDRNTADVYLTDLSPTTLERLASGEVTPEVSGTLLHVHIFLNPKPGRTPIEPTAASATARLVVVSRGQIGVYDGAGFLMPGRSLRKNAASGRLRNAAARLTRATEGFNDLLGSSRMEVTFGATSDEPTASAIAAAVRTLALAAEPVKD